MNQEILQSDMQCMNVTKRNGQSEEVSFDKVLRRIKNLSSDLSVNPSVVAQKINSQIFDGVTTAQLDELSAEICAHMTTVHPDYGTLASRIIISNHHKNTSPSLSEVAQTLWNFKDVNGKDCPLINKKLYQLINNNKEKLNSVLNYQLDYRLDYFGFKTLERAYLLTIKEYDGKNNGKKKVVERPQHMYMRVALAIHGKNIKEAIKSYKLMAEGYFTHATPTLYNLGTNREQASSCFLLSMASDSIDGIYDTLKRCALISKNAGGIGLSIHNIRASGSLIRGTNGTSNGIVPMLRVFNNTARYVDQGGSKRNGSFAIYIEPWHADIEDYLMLKRNTGFEENRARDLFYAMWIPDLFMKRVKADADWTLMCPDECPGLYDLYGDEFEEQYEQYEKEGRGRKTIKAREIWLTILESQIETGTPYILYKDACNRKSNQKNLGTIRSSNLCAEIVEYSSADEIAVCNLASIALPRYVENGVFNFQKLEEVVAVAVRNLNKIIDINYYPVGETKNSNLKHRPIGVGVQGLADVFALMRISFDSPEAKQLNKKIFEHMYWAALNCSMEISRDRQPLMVKYKELWLKKRNKQEPFSKEDKNRMKELKDQLWLGGIKPLEYEYNRCKYKNTSLDICHNNYMGAYSSFEGSPASKGILQYDMWEVEPSPEMKPRFDTLKEEIINWGTRNSLLIALMPTASTSQILGNNECFEPYTSNIYKRRTLAGEFKIINKHLLKDLIHLGIWSPQIKDQIILNEGSIQNIDEIPNDIKKIYKTVWEMKQRILIDMATDRGAFICQTQSLNLFMAHPTFSKLSKMHFYGWEKGLKTGIYYLRSLATAKAQQFTIDPSKSNSASNGMCNKNDPNCEACGS